jgi:hypothetical protein
MSNKLLLVVFLILVGTSMMFSQTVMLEPMGVSEAMVVADTVGNPNYLGIFGRVSTGLLNVGVETQMVLKGTSDQMLAGATWNVTQAPDGSTAGVMNVTAIDTSTELANFTPDLVGTYVVEFADQGVTASVTINAGTYLGAEGGSPSCSSCHSGTYAKWQETGHASIFNKGLNGTLSDHWGESCIGCHTTGYDLEADNDGFDDRTFVFPDSFGPGMLDSMLTTYPDAMLLANIQCESCHGPGSAHFGNTADSKMVYSLSVDVCASCHSDGNHHVFPDQFALSVHGNPTTLSRGSEADCAPCHSGSGFVAWIKNGKQELAEAPAVEKISCAVCHDPHDAGNVNQLRTLEVTLENGEVITNAGKGALCMNCHKSRRIADEYTGPDFGYSSHYGPHHGPQAEILSGKNMPTFGKTLPNSPHLGATENACVSCHMAEGSTHTVGMHTFSMVDTSGMDNVEACAPCHGELTSFAEKKYYLNGNADHDGDGVAEGLQEEVEGMLHELGMMLPPTANDSVDISGRYIYTQTEAKAAYNWFAVEEDRSLGIHNPAFVVTLLKVSMMAVENNGALGSIVEVTDVPNDQGKQVRLIWNKFADDGIAIDPVKTYSVKRDDGDDTWTTVAELTADGSGRYAMVVPTLYDSTADGEMLTTFKVVAITEGGMTMESEPMAGHSIDNLVPMVPQNLFAIQEGKDVDLTWDEAVDPDVNYYRVFRSTVAGFEPSETTQIGTTASIDFTDAGVAAGTQYYKIVAVDFSGNVSDASDEVEVAVTGLEDLSVPTEYRLSQNYPNPFNPVTKIEVALRDAGHVSLNVYNSIGQKVISLLDKEMTAGVYTVNFSGNGFSSGVYFYKIIVTNGSGVQFESMRKMILMK